MQIINKKIKNAKLSGFQMPGYKASCSKSADHIINFKNRQFPHFVVETQKSKAHGLHLFGELRIANAQDHNATGR